MANSKMWAGRNSQICKLGETTYIEGVGDVSVKTAVKQRRCEKCGDGICGGPYALVHRRAYHIECSPGCIRIINPTPPNYPYPFDLYVPYATQADKGVDTLTVTSIHRLITDIVPTSQINAFISWCLLHPLIASYHKRRVGEMFALSHFDAGDCVVIVETFDNPPSKVGSYGRLIGVNGRSATVFVNDEIDQKETWVLDSGIYRLPEPPIVNAKKTVQTKQKG